MRRTAVRLADALVKGGVMLCVVCETAALRAWERVRYEGESEVCGRVGASEVRGSERGTREGAGE